MRSGIRDTWGWNMSGQPLDLFAAAHLSADRDYCQVAESLLFPATTQPDTIRVTTVFLVIGAPKFNSSSIVPPLFETMIFINGAPFRSSDLMGSIFGFKVKCWTFEEARAAHLDVVLQLHKLGMRLALPTSDEEALP